MRRPTNTPSADFRPRTVMPHLEAVAPVRESALVALTGRSPGVRHDLVPGRDVVLGSGARAVLRLDDPSIGARHLLLVPRPDGFMVKDLGSPGGTYVNDKRVTEYALRDGDLLQVGRHLFRFLSGRDIDEAYREEIFRLGIRDPLTGLASSEVFFEALAKEVGRASRTGQPVAIVLFDVDHMRNVAREHGTLAGDACLKTVGGVLRQLATSSSQRWPVLRPDMCARSRGDRFAVAFPGATEASVRAYAEAVRVAVKSTRTQFEQHLITVTISAGVASILAKDNSDALIARANARLKAAKAEGRDRVK